MERRFTATTAAANPVTLAERRDGRGKAIIGYGAVFYDGTPGTQYQLGSAVVERIMPGAFDKALSRPDDVRGLLNHDPNQILGRSSAGTMRLSVDAKGLRYEIDTANTTTSQDVQEHLRRGDLSGSSFAFTVDAEEWDDNGPMILRLIRAVTVYDCGPVTFPAYTASTSGNRDTTAGAMPTSTTPANDSLAGRLAAYRVRARLCEIGANA